MALRMRVTSLMPDSLLLGSRVVSPGRSSVQGRYPVVRSALLCLGCRRALQKYNRPRLEGAGPVRCALRGDRPNGCAVVKDCLVMSGEPQLRWKKADKTSHRPAPKGTENSMWGKRRKVERQATESRCKLGRAWVRLGCLNP